MITSVSDDYFRNLIRNCPQLPHSPNHFTNGLWSHNPNFITKWIELSWHVQNCDLIQLESKFKPQWLMSTRFQWLAHQPFVKCVPGFRCAMRGAGRELLSQWCCYRWKQWLHQHPPWYQTPLTHCGLLTHLHQWGTGSSLDKIMPATHILQGYYVATRQSWLPQSFWSSTQNILLIYERCMYFIQRLIFGLHLIAKEHFCPSPPGYHR